MVAFNEPRLRSYFKLAKLKKLKFLAVKERSDF
jgi:hypothetical protein